MKKAFLSGVLAIALCFAITIPMTGCNDWERTTFQTLSASDTTINQAQADYEAGTITNTTQAFQVITAAKAAQSVAVNQMVAYEQLKATGATPTALTASEAQVVTALAQLPTVLAEVEALRKSASVTVTSGKVN